MLACIYFPYDLELLAPRDFMGQIRVTSLTYLENPAAKQLRVIHWSISVFL